MKRILFVLGTVLFLALLLAPSSPASAASVSCVADPAVVTVGDPVTVICTGFTPNEMVTAWLTEPDGHVRAWPGGKVDATGSVAITFPTSFGGVINVSLGEWAVTVKGADSQLIGIGRANVGGKAEAVAGAKLTATSTGRLLTLEGTGFDPFEMVSFWVDSPNGDCSGFIFGIGISSETLPTIQADMDGNVALSISAGSGLCGGLYHFVARGNTSRLGAETFWGVPNQSVTETAVLVATPSVVPVGELAAFSGTGFTPKTGVSCWATSPQGQVASIGGVSADGSGNVGFALRTDFFSFASLGALGDWVVTCRSGTNGPLGIAHFSLAGNVVDP